MFYKSPTTYKQVNVTLKVPGKVYTGETKMSVESRLKQLEIACSRGQTAKLAIAEHTWSEDHPHQLVLVRGSQRHAEATTSGP